MAVGIADPDLFAQAQSEGEAFPFAAHNPNFQVDLAAIPLGTQIGTLSVLEILTAASS
jgi:hippurate hydrolase